MRDADIHATIARIGAEADVKKLLEIALLRLEGEEYLRAQEEANTALLAIFRLHRMVDRALKRERQQDVFARPWEAPDLSGRRPELDELRRQSPGG